MVIPNGVLLVIWLIGRNEEVVGQKVGQPSNPNHDTDAKHACVYELEVVVVLVARLARIFALTLRTF